MVLCCRKICCVLIAHTELIQELMAKAMTTGREIRRKKTVNILYTSTRHYNGLLKLNLVYSILFRIPGFMTTLAEGAENFAASALQNSLVIAALVVSPGMTT